ncbi:hypothetical protein MYX77_10575 [Acidobacteriia bacterium AH_259_A11_L15]|nr:hypothetical protein [Acidobacteriia bacterium AH_259_A11_L15]
MRCPVVLLICLAGFLVPGGAAAPGGQEGQPSAEGAASLEIKSGYMLEEGEIHFAPFGFVDWGAQARRHADVDVEHPSPEQLQRLRQKINMFGSSAVSYEAPLGPGQEEGFYYLLTSNGVEELQPRSLTRTVSFTFDAEKNEILEVAHYGFVVATPASGEPAREGGFVLWSGSPLETSRQPVTASAEGEPSLGSRVENGQRQWFFREGGRTVQFYEMEGPWPEGILAAYVLTVRPGNRRFLLVRWEPDRACASVCCGLAYDLYEIGPELESVTFTYYQCEV